MFQKSSSFEEFNGFFFKGDPKVAHSRNSMVFFQGCPKSHYTKVRAYCSACDHLICKISSGMFQKSSSFEEFNGFSEIDVHFFE